MRGSTRYDSEKRKRSREGRMASGEDMLMEWFCCTLDGTKMAAFDVDVPRMQRPMPQRKQKKDILQDSATAGGACGMRGLEKSIFLFFTIKYF